MYQYQAFNEHVHMWVYVFYTGTTCSTCTVHVYGTTYMNVLTTPYHVYTHCTTHITDDLKRVVHFF